MPLLRYVGLQLTLCYNCLKKSAQHVEYVQKQKVHFAVNLYLADRTGLEPATSAVTGRHSNQLNYRSNLRFNDNQGFNRGDLQIFRDGKDRRIWL